MPDARRKDLCKPRRIKRKQIWYKIVLMFALIGKFLLFFTFVFWLVFQPSPDSLLPPFALVNQKHAFCICIFTQTHPQKKKKTNVYAYTCKYVLAYVRVSCLFLCKWHISYFSTFRYLFNLPLPFAFSHIEYSYGSESKLYQILLVFHLLLVLSVSEFPNIVREIVCGT